MIGLPSSTTVLINDSTRSLVLWIEREPRKHNVEHLRRAKLSVVLVKVINFAFESSLFSLIFEAILLITREADGPAPPVQAKIS